jgi:hypothetical protein
MPIIDPTILDSIKEKVEEKYFNDFILKIFKNKK